MPFNPVSVGAFTCERLLRETEAHNQTIFSAIRIVDVWYVPANEEERMRINVKLHAIITIKTRPSEERYVFTIAHELPSGQIGDVGRDDDVRFTAHGDDPAMPVGMTMGFELTIGARLIGTHSIIVSVRGVDEVEAREVARATFTFVPRRANVA